MTRWFVLGLVGGGRAVLRSVPRLKQGAWHLLDAVLLIVGLGLIVVGVAHWSPAAAYVAAGVAVIGLGMMPIRRRS